MKVRTAKIGEMAALVKQYRRIFFHAKRIVVRPARNTLAAFEVEIIDH